MRGSLNLITATAAIAVMVVVSHARQTPPGPVWEITASCCDVDLHPLSEAEINLRQTAESSSELHKNSKSHQRQLVDSSNPTYEETSDCFLINPTNGSWWILQVQPKRTKNCGNRLDLNNPPTAVGGISTLRAKWASLDSKPKLPSCGPLMLAKARGSSPADSSHRYTIRRPPASLNSELWTPKPVSRPEDESVPAAESSPVQGQTAGATETQELAKKLSNPVASLISFPIQSNFDFGMGTGSGWRYTLNVQPVIPIKLSENWNLISRTIIPIIHQGNVTGPNTSQNGLGDTVQSLFFSPNKTEPLIWAVGPVFLLPTATDRSLGAQKWGVGPTALALKQKSGWTYGVLANHIWSVAGKSNRADVNATFIQPFLSYTNKQAWTYSINTESTYDWESDSWSIPINPFISKLVRFGKQPVSFGGGLKCWVTTPTGGPEGCGLRIVVTALFPKR